MPTQPPPEPEIVELELTHAMAPFLGTGHHFEFLPFDPTLRPELRELAGRNTVPWMIGSDAAGRRRLLWIRARICTRDSGGESLPGLLICLETNPGEPGRGWPISPIIAAPQDTLAGLIESAGDAEPYLIARPSEAPGRCLEREVIFSFGIEGGADYRICLKLSLEFPDAVAEPIDVDLIIDFGNTRTVVLGLEHNQAANGLLSQICRPIEFYPRSAEPSDDSSWLGPVKRTMIDSWFVLAEPLFSCVEPPSEGDRGSCDLYSLSFEFAEKSSGFWPLRRQAILPKGYRWILPQSCVQLSPAVLGAEAEWLLPEIPLEAGGNFFLSSPKRYCWDTDRVGRLGLGGRSCWTMTVHPWNPRWTNYRAHRELPKLAATVLLLMDEAGGDWQLDGGGTACLPTERPSAAARPTHSPDSPAYPRSDTLTWAALAVLENAYRHIMSEQWRRRLQNQFVGRRIRNVVVTFPSGWTGQELKAYRSKWQKAIDIFTVGHLADWDRPGTCRPQLVMELDEAVAAQLPILYGEIQKLGNIGENWIEMVGRGAGTDARVRILNLDIGGGTTDTAVIEYWDDIPGPGVVLNAELLYKDSSTTAGDALVRRIIETVLLPAIARGLPDAAARRCFAALLASTKQERTAQWNRLTRQLFIPIVQRWLEDLASDSHQTTGKLPTPASILGQTSDYLINEFNELCRRELGIAVVLHPNETLHGSPARLNRCVEEVFGAFFASLAKVVAAFDCDLVIVSGKPSELPPVQEMLRRVMPLAAGRVLFAHNYEVGRWYPLSIDGRIRDAKSVTVAGAALYQAVKAQLLPHWIIKPAHSSRFIHRNFWGMMPLAGERDFAKLLLTPEQDEASCTLMIGSRIGRRLLPTRTRPDPVYRLRWTEKGREAGNEALPVALTLRRCPPEATCGPERMEAVGEKLEIVGVVAERGGRTVQLNDLELQLCTLDTEDFWMDSGIFNMEENYE